MINITTKFKGLDKLKKKLNKLVVERIPKLVAEEAQSQIKDNLRKSIKTGNLHRSIQISKYRNSYRIVSTLPYAKIQDKGGKIVLTERMRAKMWALYYATNQQMYKNIAITKKNYIIIPAKNYTRIDRSRLIRAVKLNINKELRKL